MGGLGTGLSLHNIFCPRSAQILSKACNAGKEHKPVRYGWTTLARVLMAHTEWLPGVWLRHFCTTLALHIEDCDGVGGCPVVIAQWQSTDCTSQVSWVGFLATAILFTFLYLTSTSKKNLFFLAWARIKAEILLLNLSENFLQWKILVNVQTSNDVATGGFHSV